MVFRESVHWFLGSHVMGEADYWLLRAPTVSIRLRIRRLAQETLHTFTALYGTMTRQVVLCEYGYKHALVTGNEGRDRFIALVSSSCLQ